MSVGRKYYHQTDLSEVHDCVLLLYVKDAIFFSGTCKKKLKKEQLAIYALDRHSCYQVHYLPKWLNFVKY